MRFSAAARNRCFTNRLTSQHGGPPTIPAPPTETTDAQRCQDHVALRPPARPPLLARSPLMVWRRGLRKLSSLESLAVQLSPPAYSHRILCRAAQPPLVQIH